jgi:hypothetical protein
MEKQSTASSGRNYSDKVVTRYICVSVLIVPSQFIALFFPGFSALMESTVAIVTFTIGVVTSVDKVSSGKLRELFQRLNHRPSASILGFS